MILMSMRHNQARELLATGSNKAQVGHLHRGSQRTGHLLQGNTTVHGDPLVSMAEEIEVHADLATPAQGEEDHIATTRLAHSKSFYQV